MRKIAALLYYLKIYPWRSAWLVTVILLCAILEFVSLSLFIPVIEYIQNGPNMPAGNQAVMVVVRALNFLGIEVTLFNLLAVTFLSTTLQFLLIFTQNTLTAYLFFPIRKVIRDRCFTNLMGSSLAYYTDRKTGDLINIMTERIDTVGYAIGRAVQLVADALLVAAYLFFMILVSWHISLVVLGVALIKYLVTMAFIQRSKRIGHQWLEAGNRQFNKLVESLQGIRLIKSFSREEHERANFSDISKGFSNIQIKATVNEELMTLLDNILAPFLFVVIILLSVEVYHVSGSYVFIYVFALMKMVPKLTKINVNRNQLSVNLANAEAILDLLEDRDKPRIVAGNRKIEALQSAITLESLYFSYKAGREVLKDVSFLVKKGERVAIVGASGSGKSSIINLLLHLYVPDSGRICVNGIDLKEFNLASWHKMIGLVDQETVIFNDTVYNNILYGNLDASRAEVIDAAKKAQIHETIIRFEDGYETILGERGTRLSGGQR